jgi:hypothetical protein
MPNPRSKKTSKFKLAYSPVDYDQATMLVRQMFPGSPVSPPGWWEDLEPTMAITFRCDEVLVAQLDAVGKSLSISRSDLIRRLCGSQFNLSDFHVVAGQNDLFSGKAA